MTCRHEDCSVVKECIKLVWMAATDAVVHPEYIQLLENSYMEMVGLSLCSEGECLIQRAFPEAADQSLAKIFLQKILSNPQAPDSVVQRVLRLTVAHTGDRAILEVVTELSADTNELDALEVMDEALSPE